MFIEDRCIYFSDIEFPCFPVSLPENTTDVSSSPSMQGKVPYNYTERLKSIS